MAKSPDKPASPENVEQDSLPWQPSSAPLVAEDFSENPHSPEEAIGGGSHRGMDETAGAAAESLARTATLQDALADAIAAAIGFVAAVLFRR